MTTAPNANPEKSNKSDPIWNLKNLDALSITMTTKGIAVRPYLAITKEPSPRPIQYRITGLTSTAPCLSKVRVKTASTILRLNTINAQIIKEVSYWSSTVICLQSSARRRLHLFPLHNASLKKAMWLCRRSWLERRSMPAGFFNCFTYGSSTI